MRRSRCHPSTGCGHGGMLPDALGEQRMSSGRIDWSGEFVVCVTPFAEDGAFDESACARSWNY